MTRVATPLAVAAGAFAVALGLRVAIVDRQAGVRRETRLDEDVLKSPGRSVLRVATMEHRHGWADLVWLGIVQELARPFDPGAADLSANEASWDRIERWSELATDLDEKYLTVYHSAAVHLSIYARRARASDAILQKGRREIPRDFRLPFMLGYNAYFLHADGEKASEYFLAAADLPGAPAYLHSLAGRLRAQAGDEEGAILMLEMLLADESLQERVRENIEYRLVALKSEPRLRLFDAGCEKFRQEHGRLPESGEELRAKGYVDAAPADLFGASIVFEDYKGCLAITDQIPVREAEARRRLGSRARPAEEGEEQIQVEPMGEGAEDLELDEVETATPSATR